MFSRFLKVCCVIVAASSFAAASSALKVCANPDNLPFSNIGKRKVLITGSLHCWPGIWDAKLNLGRQRAGRGFVRENLNKGVCDVLVGVPVQFRPVLTTSPYYSSSYVFVTRKDRHLNSIIRRSTSAKNENWRSGVGG